MGKVCQTQGGLIRTKNNLCVTGEDGVCCCAEQTTTCTNCPDDTAPLQLRLSVSGLSGSDLCNAFNGDFILDFSSAPGFSCEYQYLIDAGDSQAWVVFLSGFEFVNPQISARALVGATFLAYELVLTGMGPMSCLGLSNLTLPFLINSGFSCTGQSSATVILNS